MRKKILIFFIFLFSFLRAYNQYYNQRPEFIKANGVWAFGDSAGVTFNGGRAVAVRTSISTFEGCAVAADPVTGQLLFYSDGWKCWDRNHQVMSGGSDLLGAGSAGSTTQASCIVPVIDTPGKYYLFSLNSQGASPGLYYSVVNMARNSGLGDIEPNRKNILLDSGSLSEAMIAIPGDNCDVWLMVHTKGNPIFKSYHITRFGLDVHPVISVTGAQIQGASAYFQGGMAIAPNRKMLAIASVNGLSASNGSRGLLLCKFDGGSGQVSDASLVNTDPHYNVCFSPDNSKLYGGHGFLNQYEVSNFLSSGIIGIPAFVANAVRGLKLYNDTIYCISGSGGSLSRFNKPNLAGNASNFQAGIVALLPGTRGNWGLPSDVIYPLPPDTIGVKVMDTLICLANEQPLNVVASPPQGYVSYLWNDGATDTLRIMSEYGTYWVLSKDECHTRVDTFVIRGARTEFNLGPDTVICFAPPYRLSGKLNGVAYFWQDGSTDSFYTVDDDGSYWAEVTRMGCKISDTIAIRFKNVQQDIGDSLVFCKGAPIQVRLSATPSEGAVYHWSTGEMTPDIVVHDPGKYWITVENLTCLGTDTLEISNRICDCALMVPNAFSPNGDGRNDIFKPMLEPGCTVNAYLLLIYNRWGQLVYSVTGNYWASGWDGTIRGTPADAGTYTYQLRLEVGTEKKIHQKTGDVILLR